MRKAKPIFEQIPVAVVKRIIEEEVSKKNETGSDAVIVENAPKKTKPYKHSGAFDLKEELGLGKN